MGGERGEAEHKAYNAAEDGDKERKDGTPKEEAVRNASCEGAEWNRDASGWKELKQR